MAGSRFRSLYNAADDELFKYLDQRNVSRYFLIEIDQFLAAHQEIADYCSNFTDTINHSSPLEAYQHFVDGYKKPARYNDEEVSIFFPPLLSEV